MTHDPNDTLPMQAPLSVLERALIDAYLRLQGHDPAHLEHLPAGQRDALLRSASLHASERLAEIESRANYVHELHDGAPGRANNGQG
jgi:hypothetical protein